MKFLLDTNVFREIGKTEPHPHVSAWLVTRNTKDFANRSVPMINPYKSPPERLP